MKVLLINGSPRKKGKEMKATYPKVNWKEGKLLNRVSKQELEAWVKTSVQ